uniref:Uncharacterized protein MANES_01G080300 n=1 Tax=Rhizophora mucronata TaxID=61149 RepID=A0A2P2LJR5_RHIMU
MCLDFVCKGNHSYLILSKNAHSFSQLLWTNFLGKLHKVDNLTSCFGLVNYTNRNKKCDMPFPPLLASNLFKFCVCHLVVYRYSLSWVQSHLLQLDGKRRIQICLLLER